MTTKAGVGTSHHHHPNLAGREAAEQGLRSGGIVRPNIVFTVGPDAPWAGFYTIGEIGPVEEHNDRHLYTSVVFALS